MTKQDRKVVFETPRFVVIKSIVNEMDGAPVEYYHLEKPDGVAVIASYEEKIVILKVTRLTTGKTLFELPGGRIEADETPKSAARREFFEETGLRVNALKHLTTMAAFPALTSERIHVFTTTLKEAPNQRTREPHEGIVGWKMQTPTAIMQMIKSGKVAAPADVNALVVYFIRQGRQFKQSAFYDERL